MEAPESLLSQKFHNPSDYRIQGARGVRLCLHGFGNVCPDESGQKLFRI